MASQSTQARFGRVGILNAAPLTESGRYPARVECGEYFTFNAQVFMEGRATVGATGVLRGPDGRIESTIPMTCVNPGLDLFTGATSAGTPSDALPWEKQFSVVAKKLGKWTLTIEGWEDAYTFWLHDAHIKVSVNDDVENILDEGAQLFTRWVQTNTANGTATRQSSIPHMTLAQRKLLTDAAKSLRNSKLPAGVRLAAADSPEIHGLAETNPLRDHVTTSAPLPFKVERPHSSFASWYQFFPRSEGAHYNNRTHKLIPGNLKTSVSGLQRAKDEGFSIVYLPPIFPIGTTNRKGRNNTLTHAPTDPGSPWAIGSKEGGHDTVDPTLGTMQDFKNLTQKAHKLGLEVALDFALQCSPDHPWVRQHPEWFRHKADGSIAFAENPPKKYEDIYPIDFNADMDGLVTEVVRILNLWIDAGVTIFRVDNPHTKPVEFWQRVIEQVTENHPEVLFLAEAFTRPAMMRALSYAGFTQSHSYFPWRNTKEELEEYLARVNGTEGYFQHSTFWPSTPDILTDYLRDNGIAGHAVRAVAAAMGSPSWGIYNGYELIENQQRPGSEEQLDNEKYEVKARDWAKAPEYGISTLLTTLNRIRNAHPSTRSFHNLTVQRSDNGQILVFSRFTPAQFTDGKHPDALIVVINLDAHNSQSGLIHLDLASLGLEKDAHFTAHELLTDRDFAWDANPYVSLAPWSDVAHIVSVEYR